MSHLSRGIRSPGIYYVLYNIHCHPAAPVFNFSNLVLLVLLLKEFPVKPLVGFSSRFAHSTISYITHLMKSASSELEALIGGAEAAEAGFLGPEAA